MKRHAFDPFSLVAGLLFGFFALYFLNGEHSMRDLAWPWAAVVPLLAIGLLAILVGARRAFDHGGEHADETGQGGPTDPSRTSDPTHPSPPTDPAVPSDPLDP